MDISLKRCNIACRSTFIYFKIITVPEILTRVSFKPNLFNPSDLGQNNRKIKVRKAMQSIIKTI